MALGWRRSTSFHELPNPYDRLNLEIVGACFALNPAKTRTYNDRDAFFHAPEYCADRHAGRTEGYT